MAADTDSDSARAHGDKSQGVPIGGDVGPPGKFANRLIHETSPYLLQHAHNPVDWYPWGAEAFQRAQQEDKPIFLSVGYSTCYWCHVMERESFEDDSVAEILNDRYVAIKVDREERLDIDEQYMLAAQLMTGRGGWPNSVWLTPAGKPWLAGAYFPPEPLKQLLRELDTLWRTRRSDVEQQAERLAAAVRDSATAQAVWEHPGTLHQQFVDRALAAAGQSFDAEHGGFGSAPKFPPHDRLLLLAHEYRRVHEESLLLMLTSTLDAMAAGGIHDHLGGGFHRYATDGRWLLPHFEKMLYDNAQLIRAYADGYLLTGNEIYREVVQGIVAWIRREMTHPAGAFYCAIDAESEHEEGKFYVWTYDEVVETLGKPQGELFAEVYGMQREGNYVDQASGRRLGTNVLYLPRPLNQVAQEKGLDPAGLKAEVAAMREKLLGVRSARVPPHSDDKILSSWNGLMISSLAYAGRHLKEPSYVQAAARAAQFILATMSQDGRLLRTYRAGQARLLGYLDDYAFFSRGLLDIYEATNDPQWLGHARRLTDIMLEDFQDNAHGGFFFTTPRHENLLVRSKNLGSGGNIPAGNGVAAEVLLRLGSLSGRIEYQQAAERTLAAFLGLMWQQPQMAESLIRAAAMSLQTREQGSLAV